MSDNNLRIAFDYKYPDDAALVVYSVLGETVTVEKIIAGIEAVELYSRLSGKTVENIKKEAGYTKYDVEC